MEHFAPAATTGKPIAISIHAMGGQGGGVLADWIVALAEANAFVAQATSVPGVAQRTGATIYYVEIMPRPPGGASPVMAMMPTPGDVDLVVAAELMEAGRAIQRGLVTPDRTTLIASTHRALATSEKMVPGDGVADGAKVVEAARVAARRTILFDMAALAERNGSVVSATLLGAIAASGVLPFERGAYEAAIRAGGVGVAASLKAFAAAYDRAAEAPPLPALARDGKRLPVVPDNAGHPELDRLLARLRAEFPANVRAMLYAGLQRLVDYQDPAYGHEYLDRMGGLLALDRACGGEARAFALTSEAARQIAVAMAYDDVYRVADLKTRASRFARVRAEVGAAEDQILGTTEFMHPRMDEVCGSLPKALGLAIERRRWLFNGLDRIVNRGRRVRTSTVRWFVPLYLVGGLKRWRRGTLRHAREMAHMAQWLAAVERHAPVSYELGVELLKCRRLVKGYSDTHARGHSKFDRVMAAVEGLATRPDAADWVRRLRTAALADEAGVTLDGALKTVATL